MLVGIYSRKHKIVSYDLGGGRLTVRLASLEKKKATGHPNARNDIGSWASQKCKTVNRIIRPVGGGVIH